MASSGDYSPFFSCLYDELQPVGSLGRGTHYSVFRTAQWLNTMRRSVSNALVHDFAVIWDEDHDTRVIDVLEDVHMAGLLSPVLFAGERKGSMTVIVDAAFYFRITAKEREAYVAALEECTSDNSRHGDYWPLSLGYFNSEPTNPAQTDLCSIISDTNSRVELFARNVDSLWSLGHKDWARIRQISTELA
jgi:hypothetical protein